MKNSIKIIISLIILTLLAFLGVRFLTSHYVKQQNIIPVSESQKTSSQNTQILKPATEKTTEQKIENQKNIQENQSVIIVAGNTTVRLPVVPNTIFYDILVRAKNSGTITFAGKNYPGLGFFVTDIGTLHAGDGKDLLYYINGKESTVGVSMYTLKDGDIIEWKLE